MNLRQTAILKLPVLVYAAAMLLGGCEHKSVFRSGPGESLTEEAVRIMIETRGFFDSIQNKAAAGFANDFETQNEELVVLDRASGLLWQRSGSPAAMNLPNARNYIAQLNESRYAGYRDWRLPTLEEAMSLVETSPRQANAQHLDPRFDPKQRWIWTADFFSPTEAWVVSFDGGKCLISTVNRKIYVRAVRAGE